MNVLNALTLKQAAYTLQGMMNLQIVSSRCLLTKTMARYYKEMLKDPQLHRELEVKEIEETQVKDNRVSYGYRFTVITPDDIVIPPPVMIVFEKIR